VKQSAFRTAWESGKKVIALALSWDKKFMCRFYGSVRHVNNALMLFVGLAINIYIQCIHVIILAGKSTNVRSRTVCICGPGKPLVICCSKVLCCGGLQQAKGGRCLHTTEAGILTNTLHTRLTSLI
jgi:hypothetical protein